MMIIGCDFHPSWPQVSWLDTETGEVGEQKLVHASGDAKRFYEQLAEPVLVGMEATGNSQWFIELVEDLGHAIWTVRVRFPESWSSTSLATQRCPTHRQEIFVLDNAFALIEGPPFAVGPSAEHVRWVQGELFKFRPLGKDDAVPTVRKSAWEMRWPPRRYTVQRPAGA